MLIDSHQRKLSPTQIIEQAVQNIPNNKYSADQTLASVITETRMPHSFVMQEGNTLFVIHAGKDRVALFRALNADTGKNYLENSLIFTKAMYMAGFDSMVSHFDDPAIIKVFQYVARHPFQRDMGMEVRRHEDGGYLGIVQLGPQRGEK
jgi:hypothetical protein